MFTSTKLKREFIVQGIRIPKTIMNRNQLKVNTSYLAKGQRQCDLLQIHSNLEIKLLNRNE